VTEREVSELMAAYQQGDLAAFDQLYRQLAPRLQRYLAMLTRSTSRAEDLVQETFLNLHRARRTYLPGRPVVPWAFAIARHMYLMDRRRRARGQDREVVPPANAVPKIPVPPEAEGLADRDALQRALGRLPPDQLEAVTLHHVWGFSFREIGATLGVSSVTARVRAFRGMARLRQLLSREP
jgi:RNA polymerase sigma-70 factor (ECF subfamily)